MPLEDIKPFAPALVEYPELRDPDLLANSYAASFCGLPDQETVKLIFIACGKALVMGDASSRALSVSASRNMAHSILSKFKSGVFSRHEVYSDPNISG